jgi:hypothetical protein
MSTFDDDSNARLRGRRVALVVVSAIAVAFIGASALQIVPSVFGTGRPPGPSTAEGAPARECAQRIRPLALAVDRASANAWSTHAIGSGDGANQGAPLAAFRQALLPEWNDEAGVRGVCLKSPFGAEAWTALVRLRSTEEQIVLRDSSELLPIRRDFAAHLPAELR